MRRMTLLTAGLSTLLALTGAATAAEWRPAATASWLPTATAAQPPAPAASSAEKPVTVGTVESISRGILNGMSGQRGMTLHYPGAEYVKPHFSRLDLGPKDTLTVADPSGRESRTYTKDDLQLADDWATSISGDT